MNKIAILTSGGDAPGMNAAIRAITRVASKKQIEVYGVQDGYAGLVQGQIKRLKNSDVSSKSWRNSWFFTFARIC